MNEINHSKPANEFVRWGELNEILFNIKKNDQSLAGDSDGDGDFIPENVYPVADGEGGFLAGNIVKIPSSNSSLTENIGMGEGALQYLYEHPSTENITANIALGPMSLQDLTTGTYNTAIGEKTFQSLTEGISNTAVGVQAGQAITTGSQNVFIGCDTGGIDTGQVAGVSKTVAIGVNAYSYKNNQIVIGNKTEVKEIVTAGAHIEKHSVTAKNVTATLTAAECLAGVITSTSVAAVFLTLPSGIDLSAQVSEIGTTFELIIDNSAGANSVTITPSATVTAITSPFTVTNPMIVTTAQKVGCFKFYFTSETAAIVARIW